MGEPTQATRLLQLLAIMTAVLVLFAGCSVDDPADTEASDDTEATENTMAEDEASDDTEATMAEDEGTDADAAVATGPGVTDDAINLAILTDLSGPFAAGATVQVEVMRAYWDQANADGGVCDRDVVIDVQDHGYDPQTAVSQYTNIAADTLAVQQLLGSPMVAALLPQLETDGMYVGGMGWASVVLPSNVAQVPGTSYSIQGAAAIDWLMANDGLAEGDSVGVVFFEGDYGSNVLDGVAFAAGEHGMTVVEQPVTPADGDLTSQVAALQQAGVAAVILGGSPGTLGAYAGAALSAGLDVPIMGATPVFSPSLLGTPAADLLTERYTAITAIAPYSSTDPGPTEAATLYSGDSIGWEVPLAYGQALLMHEALKGACEAGDLTREGVVNAMRSTSGLDSGGVFPDGLDFTTVGEPPTRQVFVSSVNGDLPGGLELIELYEGPTALAYEFG